MSIRAAAIVAIVGLAINMVATVFAINMETNSNSNSTGVFLTFRTFEAVVFMLVDVSILVFLITIYRKQNWGRRAAAAACEGSQQS